MKNRAVFYLIFVVKNLCDDDYFYGKLEHRRSV